MTALTRSARHLAALLSDSKATPERTPEEAKRHQEGRMLAEVVMGHHARMRFKATSWTIDRDGVVCLRSEGGGIMFVNRRVFEAYRGAPLTAEEMTEHACKPEEE